MTNRQDSTEQTRLIRQLFSRKNFKRLAAVTALAMLFGLFARNVIARRIGTLLGSRILGTRVDIGEIRIGWSAISVNEIEIYEPTIANAKQFSVKQVAVVPCLWRGLQTGVWLSKVVIIEPTAEVRFDRDGKMLSVFPSTGSKTKSSGPLKILLAQIIIHNAALIVHQTGRESLHVQDVDVAMLAGERIKVKASIPNLMDGRLQLRSDVDAVTFAGQTLVSLEDLQIDTRAMAKLPLVPQEIDRERVTANFGFQVLAQHPPNELDARKHDFQFKATTTNIYSDRLKTLCERLELFAKNEAGQVSANVIANPLSGEFKLTSAVDLHAPVPELIVELLVEGCRLDALTNEIPKLTKLRTGAKASTRLVATLVGDDLRFQGKVNAGLTDNSFDSIAMPTVHANLKAHGHLTISDPTTLTGIISGNVDSENFDVAPLAKHFGTPLTSGTVIATSQFSLPLESIADARTYAATAKLSMHDMAEAELRMDDATINVSMENAVATVNVAGFTIRDRNDKQIAELRTSTTADLKAGGRIESAFQLFAESTAELSRLLGVTSIDPVGRLLVTTSAACDVDLAASPEAWTAKARVQTQSLSALGETISDIDWHANLVRGKIISSPLQTQWRGHGLMANLSGIVGQKIAVKGDVTVDSLRLNEIAEVMSRYSSTQLPLDGLANVAGNFAFEFDQQDHSKAFHASGTADLTSASYARASIGAASLQWSADQSGLAMSTSSNDFLGGRFKVYARMKELDWTRTEVEGSFSDVKASRLVALTGNRLPATGEVAGEFRVSSIASIESLRGDAQIRSQHLSIQRIPMQINQATVVVGQGQLSVVSSGSLVDGLFDLKADASLSGVVGFFEREQRLIAEIPITAQMKLAGLRVNSLMRPLELPREAQSIAATLSATCTRDQSAFDGRHLCTASAAVEDLRYDHGGLSQRITIDTVLHANRLELTGIRGRFADGALSGNGVIYLENTPTGRFELSASQVNLRRVTSPFNIKDISGNGTLKVRGRIGSVTSGQLDVSANNVSAGGIAIRKARFPVDWSFRPASKIARWQCRAGTVSLGGGNVRIASEGSFARGLSTTTSVRIEKLDIAKIMTNGSAGSGLIDGNAIVRAKNATDVNDLVGSFGIELQNIQAMKLPVLNQLPQMITLSPPVPGRGQDGGTIRGRIAGGLVHLDEVAIYQSNVQILVAGNATMTGKLNLDAIASTESDSPTEHLVTLLESPLMLAAPAPVALVVKANELLKDRVVRVHVGGTADRPTLRLQPGKQLSQDAVRFFLSGNIGSAVDRLSDARSLNQRR